MDITFLNAALIPVIVGICTIAGFIIKKWTPNERLHDFIPTVMCLLGLVLACIDTVSSGHPVTLQVIFAGMASGLASTGLYEMVGHWIDGGSKE